MHINDVTKFFGNGSKACDAIGVVRSNFTKWKKLNRGIVPAQYAIAFFNASGGRLAIKPEDYVKGESQNEDQQAA
ncbi:hypothetical protein [Aeromonas hydrophila]|nr:hypothetical protein [Aeromonas hydrophila]